MRRISRNPLKFDLISIMDHFGRDNVDFDFGRRASGDDFIRQVRDAIKEHVGNPTLGYGKRTEAMFQHVVAALGHCALVEQVDAGTIISDAEIQPPDCRLVLRDGSELLVEVKNCHGKAVKLKEEYVDALKGYASIRKTPLKIAIWWSQMNWWTLVPIELMNFIEGRCILLLEWAMAHNQMAILGDRMIAPVDAPIVVQLFVDRDRSPIRMLRNGKYRGSFLFTHRAFRSSKGPIVQEDDERVAEFLLCYGTWSRAEPTLTFDGETPVVEVSYEAPMPPNGRESYGLISIGTWSTLLSIKYVTLTRSRREKAGVRALTPSMEPADLAPVKTLSDWNGNELSLKQLRLGLNEEVRPEGLAKAKPTKATPKGS